ncbi:VOC family protein [Agarivorans aestuarii]|uniref:VOC family protein n=1 Tax=Agarivorans aestuarii TaxID=1563703 RepID=A0ABU7G6A4_9ALTE|nr:VOC family protein [Agarivorans aestuarii]MEE1674810.1 VOC family protein [Agarivorans aestuarii]
MLAVAPLVWAEIAVANMDRALAFYTEHFDLTFRRENMGDMDMAILETEDPEAASFGLCQHEMMKPSMDGCTIYLHLSEKLSPLVDKITQSGVQILMPVTGIKDGEHGYFALIVDSEGNKIGLWSKFQ